MVKVCSRCNESKSLELFGKDSRASDKRDAACRSCKNHYNKARREVRIAKQDYAFVQSKTCGTCLEIKTSDLFFKDKAAVDGLGTICKGCKTKKTRMWRERNKDHYNSGMRAYQKANPEQRYGHEIKRKYGFTLTEYNAMLVVQEGACAICKKLHNPSVKKGRLFVDHDHSTGEIRSLLCAGCNSGLGYFCDDTRVMMEAVAYIIRHRK